MLSAGTLDGLPSNKRHCVHTELVCLVASSNLSVCGWTIKLAKRIINKLLQSSSSPSMQDQLQVLGLSLYALWQQGTAFTLSVKHHLY